MNWRSKERLLGKMSSFSGSFTFNITMTGSIITGLTLNNNQSITGKFMFAGNTIQGAPNSPYAGMFFNYTGATGSVTVNSTQGIANQAYTVANNFGDATSGSVQT